MEIDGENRPVITTNYVLKTDRLFWPMKGRPLILSSDALMQAVNTFELDESRAVSNSQSDSNHRRLR